MIPGKKPLTWPAATHTLRGEGMKKSFALREKVPRKGRMRELSRSA